MKYASFGTLLKRGATTIAQVQDISGPDLTADTQDVTSHDSASAWEESVVTVLRSGSVQFTIVYDPNAATHKNAATGLIADLISRAAVAYSIVFPSSATVTWSFNAFVTAFAPDAPVSGAMTAKVSLKLTGAPTLA